MHFLQLNGKLRLNFIGLIWFPLHKTAVVVLLQCNKSLNSK